MYVSGTDVGRVRVINQDSHLVDEKNGICIVADGLGGYANGEIASLFSVEHLHKKMKSMPLEEFEANVRQAIYQVHGELVDYCNHMFGGTRMGSTILAVKIFDEKIGLVSVGDTNIYGIKDNRIDQLNHPHTSGEERMVSSALGPGNFEKVDSAMRNRSDYDYLVLCTDGVDRMIDRTEILQFLQDIPFEEWADRLIEYANEVDGSDNSTVIAIDLRGSR